MSVAMIDTTKKNISSIYIEINLSIKLELKYFFNTKQSMSIKRIGRKR